jgi:asparagine synthase (glutamine-hydrolysing)
VRQELGLARSDLRSGTDTEVLLHAWERWGEGALERLVGQWAFAIYDRAERRLWLVRDRFGEKPLFFHRAPGVLAFASSLRALLRAPFVPRGLDRAALVEYLTLRYVVAPRTVLAACEKVPPGHLLRVDASGSARHCWYEPRFRGGRTASTQKQEEALGEEFGALLGQASRRCLVSDVPVGLLLSDGIDSHSIRTSLRLAEREVPTFTYGMVQEGSGIVAAENGASAAAWDVLVTPDERIAAMPQALSSLTEPIGDGASLATWLIIHGARDKAEVFLCGHGGDELLGGYRLSQDRFRLSWIHSLAWLPAWSLRLVIESKVFGAETAAERQRAVWRVPRREVPAASRYLIHRPLSVRDVRAIFGDERLPDPYLGTIDRLYARCSPGATDLDRIQEVMLRTFLSENILSFADSVAMDSSAELRMPFLDRDVVEFALSLEPTARVSRWPGRTNTKQILRWWARGRVGDDVVKRRKHGFNYGSAAQLLDHDGGALRVRLREDPALRATFPGLSRWLGEPPEFYRGPREKALWSLLALSHWAEAAGVRGP